MSIRDTVRPLIPTAALAAARRIRHIEPPIPEYEYVGEDWLAAVQKYQPRGWEHVQTSQADFLVQWSQLKSAIEEPDYLASSAYQQACVGLFAYSLLRASCNGSLRLLDFGGGIGLHNLYAKRFAPHITIDYSCVDVPRFVHAARGIQPEATFYDDESWGNCKFDIVMASGSLQYLKDWRSTLHKLANSAEPYLLLNRCFIVTSHSSHIVLQRAHGTEYLGWVWNRADLLKECAACGLALESTFLLMDGVTEALGTPEPYRHEAFLFKVKGSNNGSATC